MPKTFVDLADLPGPPRVQMELPILHPGQIVILQFTLERQHLGRNEVLEVSGEHRVMKQILDARAAGPCQIVQVASTGKAPAWRAIKKPRPRRLAPARSPRTIVE